MADEKSRECTQPALPPCRCGHDEIVHRSHSGACMFVGCYCKDYLDPTAKSASAPATPSGSLAYPQEADDVAFLREFIGRIETRYEAWAGEGPPPSLSVDYETIRHRLRDARMGQPSPERARLDEDRTAKPKSRLVNSRYPNQGEDKTTVAIVPGPADTYVAEDGTRIPLKAETPTSDAKTVVCRRHGTFRVPRFECGCGLEMGEEA